MKKVMAFGSFDVFHKGHEAYLKEAKSLGDFLIVVIARDENIKRFKHEDPKHSEDERFNSIKELDYVDEVVLGHSHDILKIIEEEEPDFLCLGYDQEVKDEWLKEELEKRGLKDFLIVRAKACKPEEYKSSIIKEKEKN